ncbi:MAG: peptide ABC transporter substrate-binding protein [Bacillota bacterium]|nr:peptide ABC transporter substrate-binding protein [Bacillota bacterium]
MKKSKFSLLLVFALVLSVFLSACSGSKTDTTKKTATKKETSNLAADQTLNMLESAEIPTMDSSMAQDVLSFTMLNATNEGLYRVDNHQNIIDGVADGKPVANADKTVYTIHLKKDTKWSNGDTVTAHDFVYAWQRAIDPKMATPYGPYYMEGTIKNATDIANGKKPVTDLGIKALDDFTLEVDLEKPVPYFQSYVTFQLFYPLNQKYVESQGKDYAKDASHILFNGPFKMTKWDGPTAQDWTLAKNDTYWDAKDVTLTTANFNVSKDPQASANAFEAGEADITPKLAQPSILSQYEGSKNLYRYMQPSVFWLKFNEQNPALKNADIRKAIALAIDKKALTTDVLANGSIPANFIVPKDFAKSDTTGKDFRADAGSYLETDKAQAADLWKKGLATIGKTSLTLNYIGQDTESAKKSDAFIKDQLEKTLPGLHITIASVPFNIKLDREDKQQYDLLFSGWGPDYQDPMTFMDLWTSDNQQQHMSYSDSQVDTLIKQAKVETDYTKRWQELQQAEKLILDTDAAIAPLYQRAANLLVADKVKGFVTHAVGPDYSLQWIKIVNTKK